MIANARLSTGEGDIVNNCLFFNKEIGVMLDDDFCERLQTLIYLLALPLQAF